MKVLVLVATMAVSSVITNHTWNMHKDIMQYDCTGKAHVVFHYGSTPKPE